MTFKKIKTTDIQDNPFTLIGNDWLLISAKKEDGTINTMTASWGGVGVLWNKQVATIFVRPQRYTKEFIDNSEYFTLTFFDGYKKELGILGSESGRDGNKIEKVGFDIEEIEAMPTFSQGKMVMLCKKIYRDTIKPECFIDQDIDGKVYPLKDYHDMYVGEIISVYRN